MITAFYWSICKQYLFLSYKGGWIGGQCKATKTRSTLEGKVTKRWRVVMKVALITRIWVADVALQWWRAYCILLNALKRVVGNSNQASEGSLFIMSTSPAWQQACCFLPKYLVVPLSQGYPILFTQRPHC